MKSNTNIQALSHDLKASDQALLLDEKAVTEEDQSPSSIPAYSILLPRDDIDVHSKRKLQRITVYSYAAECDPPSENVTISISPSNAHNICQSLLASIDRNDVGKFKSLLDTSFIYPGNGLKDGDTNKDDKYFIGLDGSMHTYNNYTGTYIGGHHVREFKYEYYYVRPMIAALFFEYNSLFLSVLSRLAQSENALLHEEFVRIYEVCNDMPKQLLTPCIQQTRTNLQMGIDAISQYGHQLNSEGVSKGNNAINLTIKLTRYLQSMPLINTNAASLKVQSLNFKFTFLKHLHSEDKNLNVHRGWKRVVANVGAFLVSGPILNLLNFCITGDYFFCNKTTGQSLVGNVNNQFKLEEKTQATRAP